MPSHGQNVCTPHGGHPKHSTGARTRSHDHTIDSSTNKDNHSRVQQARTYIQGRAPPLPLLPPTQTRRGTAVKTLRKNEETADHHHNNDYSIKNRSTQSLNLSRGGVAAGLGTLGVADAEYGFRSSGSGLRGLKDSSTNGSAAPRERPTLDTEAGLYSTYWD